MAMLAEPRQKKRYNLTPRGKALYEDETRFGTKMLEKMGWSKGKGLGANEDGSQDFVRVRMRNTNEGLGFEDRDDHWTQHEQEFNGLLKSLNGENDQNEAAKSDKESASDEEVSRVGFGFAPEPKKPKVEKLKDKISGISLEEKSKQSKARVHYRKFTKGKDIAQYSEKDLANIFGKKVVETEQVEGIYAELNAMMSNPEKKVEVKPATEEAKEVKSNFGGVETISTGLSVSDYFRQKMEAMKNKQKNSHYISEEQNRNESSEEMQQQEPIETKKKNKKRKREVVILHTKNEINGINDVTTDGGDIKINIKHNVVKRKKARSQPENKELENASAASETNDQNSKNILEPKIRKKNKRSSLESVDLVQQEKFATADNSTQKKPKNIEEQFLEGNSTISLDKEKINAVNEKNKKSRSKKKKAEISEDTADMLISHNVDEISTSEPPKKKKKNNKRLQDDENSPMQEKTADTEFLAEVDVKKNKRTKNKEKLQDNSIAELKSSKRSSCEEQTSNKKSKKEKTHKKEIAESIAGGSAQTNQLPQLEEKTNKNVSEEISLQSLTHDELIAKCNSFNVYTVSSFCAEKFRNVDLDRFYGATISQFPGYSYTEQNLELNVVHQPSDAQRILQLWNCEVNKYQVVNPRAVFNNYKFNVIHAYKTKTQMRKKMPRFHMKSLKRKNVFQPL